MMRIHIMMRFALFGAAVMALSTGCDNSKGHLGSPFAPKEPVVFAFAPYTLADYDTDNREYISKMGVDNVDAATRIRNRMISRIRRDIEFNYRRYELDIFAGRAAFDTFADFAKLGLSLAGTVTGGEVTKTVLAAVATTAQGAHLSVSKNFFREKTTQVIVSSMRAAREDLLNDIVKKMANLKADSYSFDEAFTDLVEFFYAGTLHGAIQQIASTEGEKVERAKEARRNITARRVMTHVTPGQSVWMTAIRKILQGRESIEVEE